jgi:tRNA pseudouridine32 synthase/23S rRNA pseudouridine746 synthase
MLDFLSQRLPAVSRADWHRRMVAGDVVMESQPARLPVTLNPDAVFEPGRRLFYYRELPEEPVLPFQARVLYRDEHLLVADKPHFMPVVPTGRFLKQALLVQLKAELDLPDLSPVHRIDRDTAGLVLFSVNAQSRGAYQALFRDRQVDKVYEAVAPWRDDLTWPRVHRSRIEEAEAFFTCTEAAGEPNSETWMDVLTPSASPPMSEPGDPRWARYILKPVTGKRHQLRVHMNALGLPIKNDPFYPEVNDPPEGDYSRPLQLLARELRFFDPVVQMPRVFISQLTLAK